MASEVQMEHPPTVLLVGSVPCPLEAQADRAAEAGWRFSQVPDIYAGVARLLRVTKPRPDAVLVLVESLRGDELRFFDFLGRRWPGLAVAAVYCVSAEDRRLTACRKRGVTVLAAEALADWLIGQRPLDPTAAEPSSPAVEPAPETSSADAPESSPSRVAAAVQSSPLPETPASEPQTPAELDHPAALTGVDVFLDLPDELADLPDLDQTQEGLAQTSEYGPEDLPEIPDLPDEEDQDEVLPPEEEEVEPEQDDEAWDEPQGLPKRVPLTPWSNVPRAERRKPARTPPSDGNGQSAAPPEPPAPPPPPEMRSTPSECRPSSGPAASSPAPPARSGAWEHGLLTPEELRALLQDPEGLAGPQEGQP